MRRMENPRIVPLAWYRETWEEQEEIFGSDPWEYGLDRANRQDVETLMRYSHEQGLTKRLLHARRAVSRCLEGRKRGGFRI